MYDSKVRILDNAHVLYIILIIDLRIPGNIGLMGPQIFERWTFQPILQSTVSVDSFYMISGLLCCYLFLKDYAKTKLRVKGFLSSVPILYLHRYIRYWQTKLY